MRLPSTYRSGTKLSRTVASLPGRSVRTESANTRPATLRSRVPFSTVMSRFGSTTMSFFAATQCCERSVMATTTYGYVRRVTLRALRSPRLAVRMRAPSVPRRPVANSNGVVMSVVVMGTSYTTLSYITTSCTVLIMATTVPLYTDAVVKLMVDAEAAGLTVTTFDSGNIRIAKQRQYARNVIVYRRVM